MLTTEASTTQAQVQSWWQGIQSSFPLVLQLATHGIEIADYDMANACEYLKAVKSHIENASPDEAILPIRAQLLVVIKHLIAAMQYNIDGDLFQSDTRRERAQAALEMVRFQLLSHNVLM